MIKQLDILILKRAYRPFFFTENLTKKKQMIALMINK